MASIPTQDEVLAATRKGQEAMMAAVKTWFETVRTATPKLASVYAPLTDRLPKLPLASAPFADRLPTPADAVANAYDLAEQLLASQRRFVEELVKATAPLRPGHAGRTPETAGRNAWQQAVSEPKPKPVAEPAPKPAVSEPKPVAEPAPKPVASSAPKPVAVTKPAAVSEPKPTAAPAPKTTAARSTAARGTRKSATTRTARPSAGAKPAASKPAASPAPKGTDAN